MVNKRLTNKFLPKKVNNKVTPIGRFGKDPLVLPNYSGVKNHAQTKAAFQSKLSVVAPIQLVNDTLSFGFSTDNTWTGDNTFEGETKGTKQSTIMGHNRSLNVSVGTEKFLQIADTVLMTDTKGITAIHDGSIVGISINWNNGIPSGKFAGILMRVKVNGSVAWENEISGSMGSDKEAYFTQARDTDSFSAGDTISVCFEGNGSGSIAMSKIIVQLEYYYDD